MAVTDYRASQRCLQSGRTAVGGVGQGVKVSGQGVEADSDEAEAIPASYSLKDQHEIWFRSGSARS